MTELSEGERTVMKTSDRVYHYIGLTDETTMQLRLHILDTFKTSKLLSETIERYVIDGLERDATPEGKRKLAVLVEEYEEAKKLTAAKRAITVRQTAKRHRQNRARSKSTDK